MEGGVAAAAGEREDCRGHNGGGCNRDPRTMSLREMQVINEDDDSKRTYAIALGDAAYFLFGKGCH